MASKTRNDLVLEALANLGVLAAGQTPSTEDFQTVDHHVETTLAGLDADDIVSIADDNEIPPELFQPISVILADDAAMEFGLPGLQAQAEQARMVLRTRLRGRPTGQPQRTEYF